MLDFLLPIFKATLTPVHNLVAILVLSLLKALGVWLVEHSLLIQYFFRLELPCVRASIADYAPLTGLLVLKRWGL